MSIRFSNKFEGPFFELLYPEHWEKIIVENIPSFFDPEGDGVLQVAASKLNEPANLQGETTKYLARHGIEFDDKVVYYKTERGYDCMAREFNKDGRFWLANVMALEDRLLVVMYNGDSTPDEVQAMIISGVIQSIQIY